jgi:WD40 repeat protein
MIHHNPVLVVQFSYNSKILASGDSEGSIKFWKFTTGKCLKILEHAHSGQGITCL